MNTFKKDIQFYKFAFYGFLKNMKFFEPFILLFFREKGLSFLSISFLFSIREISINILEIPTGIIADSMGRKISMYFAFISYIISFIIFSMGREYYFFIVAMIFFALGESFRSGTHKAMIMDYLKRNNMTDIKVNYYGHTRGFSQVGSAISVLIAGFLVFYSGSYTRIFLFSVIPYIFGLALIFTYPSELNKPQKEDDRNLKDNIKRSSFYIKITKPFRDTIKDFFSAFRNISSLKALFSSSVFDAFFKGLKDYIQPIIKLYALAFPFIALSKEKKTAIVVSIIYFIIYLLTTISSMNAYRVLRGNRNSAFFINVGFIVGSLLMIAAGFAYYFKIFWLSIVFYLLFFIMKNLRKPLTTAYISDISKNTATASVFSGASQLVSIFVIIISLLMGIMADKFGVGVGLISLGSIFALMYFISSVRDLNVEQNR